MTINHTRYFPFEEIRKPCGNMFDSWQEAKEAGYDDDQIWSVADHDGTWVWGPPHHYVNVLGFVATKERHDHETYYEEDEEPEDGGDEE